MKLLHTADLHIGKMVNGFSMLAEQKHVLEQMIEVIREEDCDGLILAGDIYDRPVPSAESVKVLNDFLTAAANLGTKVFLISGNHDSPERLDFAGELLERQGVIMAGEWTGEAKKVRLEDAYGELWVYLLPFARPAIMNGVMGTEFSTNSQCMEERIKRMGADVRIRNVLVTHQFVTNGGAWPELCDSCASAVGGIDPVDAGIFRDFDYVALGHIHGPQWIGRESVRYAGSVLKYSFSETYHHKSVTLITLLEKGRVTIEKRELTPLHDMRKIKGELAVLLKEEIASAADREDYLHVTLTDRDELADPIGSLRSVYPNIMQLELAKNKMQSQENYGNAEQRKGKDAMELFREFYESVSGYEMDEKRANIINKIIREAEEQL